MRLTRSMLGLIDMKIRSHIHVPIRYLLLRETILAATCKEEVKAWRRVSTSGSRWVKMGNRMRGKGLNGIISMADLLRGGGFIATAHLPPHTVTAPALSLPIPDPQLAHFSPEQQDDIVVLFIRGRLGAIEPFAASISSSGYSTFFLSTSFAIYRFYRTIV